MSFLAEFEPKPMEFGPLEARADADFSGIDVGSASVHGRERDVFPFGAQVHSGRDGPIYAKAGRDAADNGIGFAAAGRLVENVRRAWRRENRITLRVHRDGRSVIEATSGDADERIRQELAPSIAGAPAQRRIVDQL